METSQYFRQVALVGANSAPTKNNLSHTSPCSTIAFATFMKPAMLAPLT